MRAFILILLVAAMAACHNSSKIPDEFDYGKIENGVYSNNYFDFKIPVPDKWSVQSKDEVRQLQKQGEDALAGSNSELREKIQAANVQTAILLTVFRNTPSTNLGEFNSSFIILAENLGNSGVKEAKDYLEHAKQIMKQSNMSYEFAPNYYSEKIGNRKFDAMNTSLDSVQQTYYSTINRNFALSFIISYTNEQQKAELKNIINQIRFN